MSLKILFILHTPPPVHGSSMVGKFIKESVSINSAFETNYVNLGTSKSIDEIGKNTIEKIKTYWTILLSAFVQLKNNKPDLVYLAITAKCLGFYKDMMLAFLVKLFGVPLVLHFHNKGVSTRQHKWLDNFLYKLVFKNSEVILLSEHLYPDIQKYVPKNRVHYCPNGIPDIAKSSKHDTIKQKAEILFLSNLIKTKGVFILLEACKVLKQKKLSFYCTFVGGEGDVNSSQFYSKVTQLDLKNYVNYVGKKYGKEKEEFFSKADIFSFPTYNETFGLVNLEAMQHSIPVVSTNEGGIPDVVEDGKTGFLVPQKDVHALAEKLELLIKNPEIRMEMGKKGRLKYEKEFTLEAFENRFKNILQSITSK